MSKNTREIPGCLTAGAAASSPSPRLLAVARVAAVGFPGLLASLEAAYHGGYTMIDHARSVP